MDTKETPTTDTAITSIGPSSLMTSRSPYVRTVQNFRLLWLDGSIDEVHNDDCRNIIIKLQQVINTVNTFIDVDECMDFITDIMEEKVFIIISEALSQMTISILQDIPQVSCIYIFCENGACHKQWAQQWSKVDGVYTDITLICEALKRAAQQCDQNMVSINFIKLNDEVSRENLDELDQSFMYTQILKEILLTIDFKQKHINEFLTYYREQCISNIAELQNVEKLRKEYHNHQPIWWYTYNYFLYSMLNRALRTMQVDLIIKMGFFLRDLHQHIAMLHSEQYDGHHHSDSFTVYRGQGLSQRNFDQLMKTKGGLLSFNNFLSTSLDREISLIFVDSNQHNPDLIGVLFKITVNPSIPSTFFANVRDVSYYQEEAELLFSMHSIFRIEQIKQMKENKRLWEVDLTLTSDNDPQLQALTESIQEEVEGSTGWHRLGKLMIRLGDFIKAEELYEILLQETTNEDEKSILYHFLGLTKDNQGNYKEALEFYAKELEIDQRILSSNHPNLAASYVGHGSVYINMGEYSKALSYYEKALEIYQKTLPPNHFHFAISYGNIGFVYNKMGEYLKALSYYEKTLEIYQKIRPPNHPDLSTSYNNIGTLYFDMSEYLKALLYYEKALETCKKTLPPNHPHLASSYSNIGSVYERMGEYSKALSYKEKALEIY